MFLGSVVNLFIGLTLTFGTVALAVSSITEGISSLFKLRAATLLTGMKQILNDDSLTGLAGAVLTHGAVNPLLPAATPPTALASKNTPSYIPSRQFAIAMIDILQRKGGDDGLAAGITRLNDAQLTPMFGGMLSNLANGANDIKAFETSVANWFDNAMDRLSGKYKRWVQLISLVVGIALALALNVDSFALARTLWSDPQLTMNITQADAAYTTQAAAAVTRLRADSFPVGWNNRCPAIPAAAGVANSEAGVKPPPAVACNGGNGLPVPDVLSWAVKALGCVLTATAALFGAPFWFDLLQRFVQVRSTGDVPAAAPGGA